MAGTSAINDLYTKSSSAVEQALNSQSADVFRAAATTISTGFSQDPGYQSASNGALNTWTNAHTPYIPASIADSYSDYGAGGGCVEVESLLPCGRTAGSINIGDNLELADEESLQAAIGAVSYSQRKLAQGYKITTSSGVQLVCSDSAPIPVQKGGILTPSNLLGEFVAIRVESGQISRRAWEQVVSVEPVGQIAVQHITVGDRSFWAGRVAGQYILHHNMKMVPGGGEYGDPWDWGWDLVANPTPVDYNVASGLYDEYGRPKVNIIGSDAM